MKKLTVFVAIVIGLGSLNSNLVFGQSSPSAENAGTPSDAAIPPKTSTDVTLGVTASADPGDSSQALPAEVLILRKIEEDLKEKYKKEIYIPPSIPSLIFTSLQQSLLREARTGFNTRIPTESQLKNGKPDGNLQQLKTTAVRTLSLGGIVFITPDDWTIWLNKRRITSSKLPTEAVDLRVYKDFIELKWYDAQTNQIYPVRLRTNQTFNLDAQTFVPG